jgi:hypothetical protein
MYYYKSKSRKPKTLTQKLFVDSLEEAKATIKNMGKDPKKFDFFSEGEKKDYEEANRELTQKELWALLSPEAKKLLEYVAGDLIYLTKEIVDKLVPKEEEDYFIWCYWEGGFTCSFGNHEDVESVYLDKINSNEDESFDVDVYKFRNGIKICKVDINVSVNITEIE